jgi:hypothetical protein
VDYEVARLMQCAAYLVHPDSEGDPFLRAAVLEAWAVHLRCLLEFFHPTRPDTLRAEHYVADVDQWRQACPRLTKRERARRKALHRLLAHLEIGRDARKSRWSLRDHEIVTRRLHLFLAHLPPRRRSWFPQTHHWCL